MVKLEVLYKEFQSFVGTGFKLAKGNVIDLVKFAMEFVELTDLKGTDKKDLAVRLIKMLVERYEPEEDYEEDVQAFVLELIRQGVVENLIELVIQSIDGNVNVNTVQNVTVSCFKSCFISPPFSKKT